MYQFVSVDAEGAGNLVENINLQITVAELNSAGRHVFIVLVRHAHLSNGSNRLRPYK